MILLKMAKNLNKLIPVFFHKKYRTLSMVFL